MFVILDVQTCMYCISVLERFYLQKWTLKGTLPVKCNIHVIRLPPKIHQLYFENNSEGINRKTLIVNKTGNSTFNVDLVLDTSHKKTSSHHNSNVSLAAVILFIFVQPSAKDILFPLLEKLPMSLRFVYLHIRLNIHDSISQHALLCCVTNHTNYYIYIHIYDLFLMINSAIQLQSRYLQHI